MHSADPAEESSSNADDDGHADIADNTVQSVDMSEQLQTYGCSHYQRKCLLVAPCCGKTYVCRFCHDDIEVHEINRHSVAEIICSICNTRQPVSNECVSCRVQFGRYFCLICRLYDDDVTKGQFHCDLCGMCRVGGRENFFHCVKCGLCLGISLEGSHKCVERVAHSNCPVCMENLHTSTHGLTVLKCGHVIHRTCYGGLLRSGNYSCPLCCHSTLDMSEHWQRLDEEVAATQMPDEYRDLTVWILCRDCHQKSHVSFHVLGLKCSHCGSYNTCNDSEPTQDDDPATAKTTTTATTTTAAAADDINLEP